MSRKAKITTSYSQKSLQKKCPVSKNTELHFNTDHTKDVRKNKTYIFSIGDKEIKHRIGWDWGRLAKHHKTSHVLK